MRKLLLAIVVITFCSSIASPASAQSEDAGDRCNRAWLASDWPTVVTDCLSYADNAEADNIKYKMQAESLPSNAPPSLISGALQISWASEFFAAKARARASFGYAKLKRMSASDEQRMKAQNDASAAYQAVFTHIGHEARGSR